MSGTRPRSASCSRGRRSKISFKKSLEKWVAVSTAEHRCCLQQTKLAPLPNAHFSSQSLQETKNSSRLAFSKENYYKSRLQPTSWVHNTFHRKLHQRRRHWLPILCHSYLKQKFYCLHKYNVMQCKLWGNRTIKWTVNFFCQAIRSLPCLYAYIYCKKVFSTFSSIVFWSSTQDNRKTQAKCLEEMKHSGYRPVSVKSAIDTNWQEIHVPESTFSLFVFSVLP